MATGDHETVRTLSLRTDCVGGPVADRISDDQIQKVKAALHGGTSRGLVLLIHGYNNKYTDAFDSYEAFFDIQHQLAELPGKRPLADNRVFVEVYWPGDADWGILSFLFYMGAITNARLSAQLLAPALFELANRKEPLAVEIISHSLGCRLAFELVKQIAAHPNLVLDRLVTMAGAVPTYMLESPDDGRYLRPAYDRVVGAAGGEALSLYSGADLVLAIAFPLGQTVTRGDEGFLPVALGHAGWHCALMPLGLTQHPVHHAGHSDYWGSKVDSRDIATEAQRQVREFLRFNAARARDTATRSPPPSPPTQAREPAQARRTATRDETDPNSLYFGD